MASAFSNSLVAPGGCKHTPPKISETAKDITMKSIPDVRAYKGTKSNRILHNLHN